MAGEILVVDQDLSHRDFLQSLLERKGYQVIALEDGYQIGNVLKNKSFDIIFLDSQTKGIRDRRLFSQIKKAFPHSHIIIITSKRGNSFTKEAINEGVYGCVNKSFKEEEILAFVNLLSPVKSQQHFSRK